MLINVRLRTVTPAQVSATVGGAVKAVPPSAGRRGYHE